MHISDATAVSFGFLALYAEDMYSAHNGSLNPPADPRIAKTGWKVVAYLTAQDALLPSKSAPRQQLSLDPAKRVFFGFVAQNEADPGLFAVAVRGTDGMVEWIIDAEFLPTPHPRHPSAMVEQGFWNIYQTMSLADPQTGASTHQNAAEGIEELVGDRRVIVTGHSLGSALATYFVLDLAERLDTRASACLFASPRTGDDAWVRLFDGKVADYRLFNYLLDAVTHVPALGYAALSGATIIQPKEARAGVRFDIFCNHHLICYFAMIDPQQLPKPPDAQDAGCAACVLPPPSKMPEEAIALAAIINIFGVGDPKTLGMLKGLHRASLV